MSFWKTTVLTLVAAFLSVSPAFSQEKPARSRTNDLIDAVTALDNQKFNEQKSLPAPRLLNPELQ